MKTKRASKKASKGRARGGQKASKGRPGGDRGASKGRLTIRVIKEIRVRMKRKKKPPPFSILKFLCRGILKISKIRGGTGKIIKRKIIGLITPARKANRPP